MIILNTYPEENLNFTLCRSKRIWFAGVLIGLLFAFASFHVAAQTPEGNAPGLFTALPLTVSMVRSYLYSMSASYPHSHYLLPSIDLVDLINHKFKKK